MKETSEQIQDKLMREHINFRALTESAYNTTNLIQQHKYDLLQIETATRSDVAKEKDLATGKPVFSNEALREGELQIRLKTDENYQRLLGLIGDTEDNLREINGQIAIHHNFMDVMKMCVELRREV